LGRENPIPGGNTEYVEWLRSRGVPLFEAGGNWWQLYRRSLVPATTVPCYRRLSEESARELMRKSSAPLIRYSSDPCDEPTEWWYTICDRYDPGSLSGKTRNKINKGRRDCRIAIVEAGWLESNGYSCYVAAHTRYEGVRPAPEHVWREEVRASAGGPVEYWAIFVGEKLAGYCKCVVEGDQVATAAGKYDPAFFKHRTVNGLVGAQLEHYVRDQGRTVTNGNRAILHDTNIQEFLFDHGFRKQFCRLNVHYSAGLGLAVRGLYPWRRLVSKLPGKADPVKALLLQEEWRRATAATDLSTSTRDT